MKIEPACARRRIVTSHINNYISLVQGEDFESAVGLTQADSEDVIDDLVGAVVGAGDQGLRGITGIERQIATARLDGGDVAGDGSGVHRDGAEAARQLCAHSAAGN